MSRRIEIELTSARPDGTWTWRAAGAREPKGVLGSAILSSDAKVGDLLRAEVEIELDGTTVLNTSPVKTKADKIGLLEILPSSTPFEAVTSQLAKGTRGDRGDRGDRRDRPPRRPDSDRAPRADSDRHPRRDGARPAGPGGPAGDSAGGDRSPRRDSDRPARVPGDAAGGERRDRRPRPNFTPPPELPQRPKPKRLKPGRAHRSAVLADLPEAQRPVAERALQGGIPAVRQAVQEQNVRLRAEGKEEIPAAGLIQMAEQLLPKLRVAEWLDRAEAAQADLAELALPDLRSVVASGEDPVVARDETTRALAAELKQALIARQESETLLWLDDITAALGVGRVIRALKLSSQPPKAGIRFPPELATRLADGATASLTPDAMADRWAAVIEAAAFAPVRALIKPTAPPTQITDELTATMKRLAPALPHIAALFGIEVTAGSSMPKPIRPNRPTAPARKAAPPKPASANPPRIQTPTASAAAAADTPAPESAVEAVTAVEAPVEAVTAAEAPVEAVTAVEAPVEAVTEVPVEVPVEAAEVPVEATAADPPVQPATEILTAAAVATAANDAVGAVPQADNDR